MANIFSKLNKGLAKTKTGFVGNINKVVSKTRKIDQDVLDELEELLILSDVGVETSERIIEDIQETCKLEAASSVEEVLSVLKKDLAAVLDENAVKESKENPRPFVISVVGVNGTGKTTTIGKLANIFRQQGKSVLMAAGDTFRAAAIEQLGIWAECTGSEIIKTQQGADPAAIAYDAVTAAVARNFDIVLIDTAGRLHNKSNLMAELEKVHRVIKKAIPDAPHEVLMVMDATTGQNGLSQAKQFAKIVDISGIVLTKLDGTAKGGIIFSIAKELAIPVKYIGLGEQIDDLEEFNAEQFVEALFQ